MNVRMFSVLAALAVSAAVPAFAHDDRASAPVSHASSAAVAATQTSGDNDADEVKVASQASQQSLRFTGGWWKDH